MSTTAEILRGRRFLYRVEFQDLYTGKMALTQIHIEAGAERALRPILAAVVSSVDGLAVSKITKIVDSGKC